MNQHKLYKTIKTLGEGHFRTDEQMLASILERIIQAEDIPIRGGRLWKLDPATGNYRVVHQHGDVELIKKNFRLNVMDYPMFLKLPKQGTILGTETNRYLRERGIRLYSATGVGEPLRWKGHDLYPYVIGINADILKRDISYALNILSNVLTARLKSKRIESKAKELEYDIDKAWEIQRSILPEHEMKFNAYDLYGVSLPEKVVGGDFFDYLQASDDGERLGVVVGDAASKGLSAAVQALYVSGALRMGVEYQTKISTLIGRINRLVHRTFSSERFISMVYVELTTSENGIVFYVNAGHNNPLLLRAGSEKVERLPATGQLLGPFPDGKYGTEYAQMSKGDILLLFTDGITEASDENRSMYGEQRLTEQLIALRQKSPRDICRHILQDVQTHDRLTEYSDDKTLVVVKRTR